MPDLINICRKVRNEIQFSLFGFRPFFFDFRSTIIKKDCNDTETILNMAVVANKEIDIDKTRH